MDKRIQKLVERLETEVTYLTLYTDSHYSELGMLEQVLGLIHENQIEYVFTRCPEPFFIISEYMDYTLGLYEKYKQKLYKNSDKPITITDEQTLTENYECMTRTKVRKDDIEIDDVPYYKRIKTVVNIFLLYNVLVNPKENTKTNEKMFDLGYIARFGKIDF